MIEELVDMVVEKMANRLVTGEFHIGLDAVKRFVLFWTILDREQARQESGKLSVYEYVNRVRPRPEQELENDSKDREWFQFYERTLDHYNSLNLEQKVRLQLRQKQEAEDRAAKSERGQTVEGNARRYRGNDLFPYQMDEFEILDGLKDGQFDRGLETTYKRMVSEKGYLSKMTFKEYEKFVALLAGDVERKVTRRKNVSHYKLEKRLGFQAIKSVLKALHESSELGNVPQDVVCSDLMRVLRLPFLSERQQYAEVYPSLSEDDRRRWRREIDGIMQFTVYCCLTLKEYVSEIEKSLEGDLVQESDWDAFSRIYTSDTFSNDYRQRRDFSASDFTTLMEALDKHNKLAFGAMTDPR